MVPVPVPVACQPPVYVRTCPRRAEPTTSTRSLFSFSRGLISLPVYPSRTASCSCEDAARTACKYGGEGRKKLQSLIYLTSQVHPEVVPSACLACAVYKPPSIWTTPNSRMPPTPARGPFLLRTSSCRTPPETFLLSSPGSCTTASLLGTRRAHPKRGHQYSDRRQPVATVGPPPSHSSSNLPC